LKTIKHLDLGDTNEVVQIDTLLTFLNTYSTLFDKL